MCTVIVVREEYWDRQIDTCIKLMGFDTKQQQVKQLKVFINDVKKYVEVSLKSIVEMFIKIIVLVRKCVKDFVKCLKEFSKICKECDITCMDDFCTICDKLENKMLYLNRQDCIKKEQYYRAQFKLAKVNYNIINHDKRC